MLHRFRISVLLVALALAGAPLLSACSSSSSMPGNATSADHSSESNALPPVGDAGQ